MTIVMWMAAFTVTHIPMTVAGAGSGLDKLYHFVGYLGLSALLWRTLYAYDHPPGRRRLVVGLVVPVYAALDELTQPYFGRSAELLDFVADALGMVVAVAAAEIGLRR